MPPYDDMVGKHEGCVPSFVDNSDALFRRRTEESQPDPPAVEPGLRIIEQPEAAPKPVYALEPWADRILVLPQDPDPYWSKDANIIKPEDSQERPFIGRIVAHGPGRMKQDGAMLVPLSCKVDDIVCYGKYAGAELPLNGVTYLVMREEEIIGRLIEVQQP